MPKVRLLSLLTGFDFTGAPEICMQLRYNESADTFSFALVLLSLAVGDIDHICKCAKSKRFSSSTYQSGWRPPISSKLKSWRPGLVKLIESMWHADFRQRPAMRDVADALITMAGPPLSSSNAPYPLNRSSTLA